MNIILWIQIDNYINPDYAVFQQLANAGDVTRRAYSRILQVLTSTDKLRVLVSYQPGVTLDYIRYMFKCPWDRELNDETGLIHWQVLDPTAIDSAEDYLCVYVVWRPDHKQCRNISNHFSQFKNAVALVLGDVNLMVKLSKNMRFNGLLPGFDKPLTFLVTQHDLERYVWKKFKYDNKVISTNSIQERDTTFKSLPSTDRYSMRLVEFQCSSTSGKRQRGITSTYGSETARYLGDYLS